nr:two-component response regulator orr21 [Quercus suber]
MFRMKNEGSALLRESDTTFNNFPLGLSVLIVDHDQQSLQEMEANLRRFGYEALSQDRQQSHVTECNRVEDASTLLRMEGSVFHIIIIEQCLLGVNEFELLRIVREIDLPVIVTSEDDKPDIVQRSLNYGACDYLLKPIPMSVLKMVWKYMFLKKDNKWAQVQQLTNNVSRVRNQRMSWTSDSHEKFVESVKKLGGIDNATPKKILQLLQSNFKGFEDVDREKISSHLQKYRDSIKRKAQLHMLGYRDKDGTSSEHIQSIYQMKEHPPMTLVDQVLKTMVANEPDILLQQQQAPAAKNTQGFRSVTLPFESNLPTIGVNRCGMNSLEVSLLSTKTFSMISMHQQMIFLEILISSPLMLLFCVLVILIMENLVSPRMEYLKILLGMLLLVNILTTSDAVCWII